MRFLGGTDDHALKNVLAAEAAGLSTAEFVDANAERFAALAAPLGVSFDDFVRTSADPRHRPAVERLWRACAASGDLYQRAYEGEYCVGCERFYDRSELFAGSANVLCCPEHFTPVERVAESNWFFRLSRYGDHVRRLITSGELDIHPHPFREEVLSFIAGGLEDISVSRPAARARGWGIPVPDDPTQVIYVWFDALANYLSALEFGDPDSPAYRQWWLQADRRVHVVGKGILRFHAVYWPAFLASAHQPAPTRLEVHPYLTVDGTKISKSHGPTISPFDVVDRHGSDALRWWFARDVGPVADTDFTEQRFVDRVDTDLANGVGNVANRIAVLAARADVAFSRHATPIDAVAGLDEDVLAALSEFDQRGATQAICDAVDALNRELEVTRPWELIRLAVPRNAALDRLLVRYLASVRVIATAIRPIVPALAERLDSVLRDGPQVVQPRLAEPRAAVLSGR